MRRHDVLGSSVAVALWSCVLVALVLPAACNTQPAPVVVLALDAPDGGPGPALPGAGQAADGGGSSGGGAPVDAGVLSDGGVPGDGGPALDAASALDAARALDAGDRTDGAAPTVDAGANPAICGNGLCEDAELTACPDDCRGPNACDGAFSECNSTDGSPDCVGCALDSYCAPETAACRAQPQCQALNSCVRACTDEACGDACVERFPEGVAPLDNLYTCVLCTACLGTCGGSC